MLPNWDDGPETLEHAVLLAQQAAATGVSGIVVTPHVGRSFSHGRDRSPDKIAAATEQLSRVLAERGITLDLLPGAEVMLDSSTMAARLGHEPELTVAGRGQYALVEFPAGAWPRYADRMLYEIMLRGVTPIIAHPERLRDVQENVAAVEHAVDLGVLLQVTARSVVGGDRRSQRSCRQLLQAGLVSFVASDAHSAEAVFPAEVAEQLTTLMGTEATHRILVDNPRLAIEGKPVFAVKSDFTAIKSLNRRRFWWMRFPSQPR